MPKRKKKLADEQLEDDGRLEQREIFSPQQWEWLRGLTPKEREEFLGISDEELERLRNADEEAPDEEVVDEEAPDETIDITGALIDSAAVRIPRLKYWPREESVSGKPRPVKVPARDRWPLAIHESGHAIVANTFGWRVRLVMVTHKDARCVYSTTRGPRHP